MDETGENIMNKEISSIANSPQEHGPGYRNKLGVTFTPENAQPVAQLLNNIVAFEVAQGNRFEIFDSNKADNLDNYQRSFMIVSQQQKDSNIQLSEAGIDDIK